MLHIHRFSCTFNLFQWTGVTHAGTGEAAGIPGQPIVEIDEKTKNAVRMRFALGINALAVDLEIGLLAILEVKPDNSILSTTHNPFPQPEIPESVIPEITSCRVSSKKRLYFENL